MAAPRDASLSRSAFLILLALSDQPRHGLGIVEEVEQRTAGAVRLGPGTLYTMLRRLEEDGLIRETGRAPDPTDDDPRRRYYRITPAGRAALREEAEHLRRLVNVAMAKDVLGGEA
jgi:DNA-binding PadR family transcriptional regulator